MKSLIRDKTFWRIATYLTVICAAVFLVVTFILPAGIYSCRDGAEIEGIEVNVEQWIKTCHLKQEIGSSLALLFFWPVLLAGFLTNWFILPLKWAGGAGFFLGAIPALLIEIYLVSLVLYRLSGTKR